MSKIWSILHPWEKIAVTFLTLALFIMGWQITSAFLDAHSVEVPREGGIYVEGVVGKLGAINPLYAPIGSISHDITQLVFSGLTRYDPTTRDMAPDLADFEISRDKKAYTFVIHKEAKWHDGTPVTANDVLFTYNDVIKHPEFKGSILNYIDYTGIEIKAIDDRTVQFILAQPDSFFLVKTLTGLLPKHLLGPIPIANLPLAQFNQAPVGTGRYRFVNLLSVDDYLEVSLEAFPDYYSQKPHIKTVLMKVFPDFDKLIKHQNELSAIHHVSDEYVAEILKKGHLAILRYTLPQYVAVFMNTESPILKERKVRLALQLGTDKKSLLTATHQTQIIDTPLLEIDQDNWVHQYSLERANGALFETAWQIQNKKEVPIQSDAKNAPIETNPATYINQPNGGKDYATKTGPVVIGGVTPDGAEKLIVNDYALLKFKPTDPSWTYTASEAFGNLKSGKNLFEVYSQDQAGKRTLIDAITIFYGEIPAQQGDAKNQTTDANNLPSLMPPRRNADGRFLRLNLIVPDAPVLYGQIAQILSEQWQKIGVDVMVETLAGEDFQERLKKRQYDLLIFGQNLGYNLDAYPYWHSSQAREGGYNLSQFKNFIVDSLLEKARLEYDRDDRQATLTDIQKIMSEEAPAIFLFSPIYYFALSPQVNQVVLDHLATPADRFARIHEWYGRTERSINEGVGGITFLRWLIKQF